MAEPWSFSRPPACGSGLLFSAVQLLPTLELIRRLDERSKTAGCMPYDNSTSKIVKRLHEHETKTVPVIEKYKQLHGVIKIDGMGTFEEVFARISAGLEDGVKSLR